MGGGPIRAGLRTAVTPAFSLGPARPAATLLRELLPLDPSPSIRTPSTSHLIALGLAFLASSLFLLQPLVRSSPSSSGEDDGPAFARFAQIAELNQIARVTLGARELARRAGEGDAWLGQLDHAVLQGESPDDTLSETAMRLVLYERLELKDAADAARERLRAGMEAPKPAASDVQPSPPGPDALDLLNRLYVLGEALGPGDSDRLQKDLGYIGALAALHSERLSGGNRVEALEADLAARALRYLVAFVITVGGVLVLLLAGGVLLFSAAVLFQSGRFQPRFLSPDLPPWLHWEAFTIYLLLMLGTGAAHDLIPRSERYPLLPSLIVEIVFLALIAYPRLHGAGWESIKRDLGLTRGGGPWKEVALGPVGYVTGLPLVAVGVAVTLLLIRVTGRDVSQGMHPIVPLLRGDQASALNTAMVFLVAVVLAPLLEEMMFRGYFYRALRTRLAAPAAIALSAAFFAGVHPQGLLGFPMLLAVGTVLATLREWRGSIWASVAAHACTNGLTLLIVTIVY